MSAFADFNKYTKYNRINSDLNILFQNKIILPIFQIDI